ncbi:MAG: thermonuclease family protein [Actinomycetota bacterium]
MKLLAFFAVIAIAVGVFVVLTRGSSSHGGVVARVIDGDTIELASGQRVRLVQIDTPEKLTECYGEAASELTRSILPPGTHVRIELDPHLDHVDRYRRQLGYVWKGSEDVNLTLVRNGAAGVWFFGGKQGRYAGAFLAAAEQARAAHKGLWGACPLARFDPLSSMSSGSA